MITASDYQQYQELMADGYSQRKACEILGIPRSTIQDFIKRLGDVPSDGPRMVFFDLETMPSIGAVFGRWQQNLSPSNIIEEGGWIITASWKWLGDSRIHSIALTPEEIKNRDDSRIVATIHDIYDQADIVCAHNLDRFDHLVLRSRSVINNMPPMKTVKRVDTLKIAKQFKFNSNRLDSLGKELGIGRKISHAGIDMWLKCRDGDLDALSEMVEYNEQDVHLLEEVYLRLRAFDVRHPNVSQFYGDSIPRCPVCGSDDVHETGHTVRAIISEYIEMSCGSCGHRSRTRKSLTDRDKKANMLVTA